MSIACVDMTISQIWRKHIYFFISAFTYHLRTSIINITYHLQNVLSFQTVSKCGLKLNLNIISQKSNEVFF